jgi:transposase-like protein
MKKKPKKYLLSLKRSVALAAIREEKTIGAIASEYEVPPHNVKFWKKQLLDNLEVVFDSEKQVKKYKEALAAESQKTDELHRQIGSLTSQLNWAKKKSKEIGYEY